MAIAGSLAVSIGAGLVYPPAGLITLGVCLIVMAVLGAYGESKGDKK